MCTSDLNCVCMCPVLVTCTQLCCECCTLFLATDQSEIVVGKVGSEDAVPDSTPRISQLIKRHPVSPVSREVDVTQSSSEPSKNEVDVARQDKTPDENQWLVFNNVWPYSWLLFIKERMPFLRTIIMLVLFMVVLFQLFVTLSMALFIYGNPSHPLYCQNPIFLGVSVLFRLFTRCGLPLVLISAVADILDHKLDRMALLQLNKSLTTEIKRPENQWILQKWEKHFWNGGFKSKDLSAILESVHNRLALELQVMCLTSVIECIIISLMFHVTGVTYYSPQYKAVFPNLPTILFAVDTISFPLITCSSSISFSFFYHELTVKHLVSCGLELEEIEKTEHVEKLARAAKDVINCHEQNWTFVELFMHFCIYYYSITLAVCTFAMQPLGCVHRENLAKSTHLYWLCFVLLFFVAHLFSTHFRLSRRGAARYRCIGIALEVFIFVLYYCCSEKIPMFGQFLHIMYGIIPSCYFFAYLWGEMYHEYRVVMYKSKRRRMKHLSRLVKNLFQFVFLTVSLVLSICSEWYLLYKYE